MKGENDEEPRQVEERQRERDVRVGREDVVAACVWAAEPTVEKHGPRPIAERAEARRRINGILELDEARQTGISGKRRRAG